MGESLSEIQPRMFMLQETRFRFRPRPPPGQRPPEAVQVPLGETAVLCSVGVCVGGRHTRPFGGQLSDLFVLMTWNNVPGIPPPPPRMPIPLTRSSCRALHSPGPGVHTSIRPGRWQPWGTGRSPLASRPLSVWSHQGRLEPPTRRRRFTSTAANTVLTRLADPVGGTQAASCAGLPHPQVPWGPRQRWLSGASVVSSGSWGQSPGPVSFGRGVRGKKNSILHAWVLDGSESRISLPKTVPRILGQLVWAGPGA